MTDQSHSYLIQIGGLTGSGKSTLGKQLARRLKFAYIDKDTITRQLVDALLVSARSDVGIGDRDSEVYLENVRPYEYQCFASAIAENVELGVSTIATAPFLTEMNNPEWIAGQNTLAQDYGAKLILIWLDCDVEVTKLRLQKRDAFRDRIKLAIWDSYFAFAATIQKPTVPVRIYSNPRAQSLKRIADRIIHDFEL